MIAEILAEGKDPTTGHVARLLLRLKVLNLVELVRPERRYFLLSALDERGEYNNYLTLGTQSRRQARRIARSVDARLACGGIPK